MRGLDLNVFDLDHDLNWHGLVMTADRRIVARFGGRDADTPGKNHSLKGLGHMLTKTLERLDQPLPAPASPPARKPRRAEDYPEAGRLGPKACIHCHHVREFQRAEKRQAGTWTIADEWIYPEPGRLGLTLDIDRGDRVTAVRPGSPAAGAGLRADDVLQTIHGAPVASIMDVQHALHHAPARGKLTAAWQRGGQTLRGEIELPEDWRRTDISWRWSLKALPPGPQVNGDDLSDVERARLGIGARKLALRQNGFVPRPAEQGGLRVNDVIVGIDGQALDMNARQFEAHVRLHFQAGQTIRYDVLRGGQRLSVPVKLQ